MTRRHRRSYPEGLKRQIVYDYLSGEATKQDLVEEYDLAVSTFHKWVRDYRDEIELEDSEQEEGNIEEEENNITIEETLFDYEEEEPEPTHAIPAAVTPPKKEAPSEQESAELTRLQKENRQLKREVDILREAILILGRKNYTYPDDK